MITNLNFFLNVSLKISEIFFPNIKYTYTEKNTKIQFKIKKMKIYSRIYNMIK